MDFGLTLETRGRVTDCVRLWWEVCGTDCLTFPRLRKIGARARAKTSSRGQMCIYYGKLSTQTEKEDDNVRLLHPTNSSGIEITALMVAASRRLRSSVSDEPLRLREDSLAFSAHGWDREDIHN